VSTSHRGAARHGLRPELSGIKSNRHDVTEQGTLRRFHLFLLPASRQRPHRDNGNGRHRKWVAQDYRD
jgi:hypothetical protein